MMGLARLPRDPEKRRQWARRLTVGRSVPPSQMFRGKGQSIGWAYQTLWWAAFEAGAQAALEEVFAEMERSDNPLAGLPPHLVKSAKAAARARARKRTAKEQAV